MPPTAETMMPQWQGDEEYRRRRGDPDQQGHQAEYEAGERLAGRGGSRS
jgi:DnaJ-domain-containing protein 1